MNNLTLTMERKTERIKLLKKRLKFVSPLFRVSVLISSLLIIYIVFIKQNILTSYISSIFLPNASLKPTSTDLLIIKIFIYSIIITIFIWILYSRIFKKYEKLRIDIIDSIDSEFCKHPQGCKCKDEYILEMDEYDIDVVFR